MSKAGWRDGVRGACTGPHHHGIHEVALYVSRGRTELRWGERLEFRAELGPGDFAYFTPGVPAERPESVF